MRRRTWRDSWHRSSPLYPDRDGLSSSLAAVFSEVRNHPLNIQYTKMIIMIEEKGTCRTTFNWDSEWTKAGGDVQKDGGRVTLIFAPGDFKLLSIDGKNPFVPNRRNAGEISSLDANAIRMFHLCIRIRIRICNRPWTTLKNT